MGKMSQRGRFVTIQVKIVSRFFATTLHPPSGRGGRKITGYYVWNRNITGDVLNPMGGRLAGAETLLGCS